MGEYSKMDDVDVKNVVDSLFSQLTVGRLELERRLLNVDPVRIRRLVVDRLNQRNVSERHGPLILAVLELVGIGGERDRLTALALDVLRPARIRMWAAMALAGHDPDMMELLMNDLGPEGMADLAENAVVELVTVQSPDKVGITILRAFEEWAGDPATRRLVGRIESCRTALGISCCDAYGETLGSPLLRSLRPQLLEYVIEEASEEGVSLLERLRDEAENDEAHRSLQSALLRLRSRRIDPLHSRSTATGRGLVSNCDGQGGFLLLGVFDNSDDTFSVSELYIRADGDILDGVVHGRVDRNSVEQVVRHHQRDGNCIFVQTSLEESASLVAEALKRSGDPFTAARSETRRAVAFFRRVRVETRFGDGRWCSPAQRVSVDDIHRLLARPEYDRAWIFDAADLRKFGLPGTVADRMESGGAIIGYDGMLRDRLRAMATHMARWHLLRDETDEAALCLALGNELLQNPRESALVTVMWERSRETIALGE